MYGEEFVRTNAKYALYVIIVLIVILLFVTIYYRGLYGMGPYTETTKINPIDGIIDEINAAFK